MMSHNVMMFCLKLIKSFSNLQCSLWLLKWQQFENMYSKLIWFAFKNCKNPNALYIYNFNCNPIALLLSSNIGIYLQANLHAPPVDVIVDTLDWRICAIIRYKHSANGPIRLTQECVIITSTYLADISNKCVAQYFSSTWRMCMNFGLSRCFCPVPIHPYVYTYLFTKLPPRISTSFHTSRSANTNRLAEPTSSRLPAHNAGRGWGGGTLVVRINFRSGERW